MDNRDNDNKTLDNEIFSKPEALDNPDKMDEIEDISTPDDINNINDLNESLEDNQYDYLDDDDSLETPAEEKPRFGEREYNAAKDEKGHYDKNYYAERQKDLDEKVKEADSERKKNYKMNEGHEDEKPKADGSNNSNKNVWDKVKDQANYANARKDQIANKVANVKNKAYQVTHPGEMLKEKTNEKLKEKTDDLKKNIKDKINKSNKDQTKEKTKKKVGEIIGGFIKKHPLLMVYAGVIIGVLFLIIFIIILFSDSDLLYSYDYQEACKNVQYTIYVQVCEGEGEEQTCHTESRLVTVNIEDYVKGIVASEAAGMNSETLKATAILARTYIIEHGRQIGSDINSCSYNVDNIGKGYNPNGITPQITKAVYDTLGYIVTVKKKVKSEFDYSCLYTASQAREYTHGNYSRFSDDYYYVRYGGETAGNYYFQAIRKSEISGFPSNFSTYINYAENENLPCYGNNGNGVSINGASFLENKRSYEWQDIIDYYYKDKNDIQTIYKDDELKRAKSEYGFFDTSCNYNDVKVNTSCNSNNTSISIKDYVLDVAKDYAEGLTDEQLKALLIIIKTNALSEGNYNSSSKNIYLNYCSSNSSTTNSSDLSSLYDSIADYLYISESYTSTITSLSSTNALQFDTNIINELKTLNGSYNNILDTLYGSSSSDSSLISDKKTLYSLDAYCTYYNLGGNNLYWWPIGSSTPTSGNIYDGDPSSTRITSYYSNRGDITDSNGNTLSGGFHKGYDISGDCNSTVVIAAKGGTVSEVYDGCLSLSNVSDSCGGGYGNHIKIDHDDGNSTYYAHLYAGTLTVQVGDRVEQGEKIALVGSSGMSSGCHLHFEVRVNNSQVDPGDYINPDNPRPSSNNFMIDFDDNGLSSKVNACLAFINSGYSINATAALVQNIIVESGGRANNLENCYEEGRCCYDNTYGFCMHPELTGFGSDELYTAGVDSGVYSRYNFIHDHAGYGIAQFTYWSIKERLYDFAKSRGSSIGSLSMQLAFIMEDVKSNYSGTYQKLTGYGSASDLTYAFCMEYEKPANLEISCQRRADAVNSTLSFVQSGCRE